MAPRGITCVRPKPIPPSNWLSTVRGLTARPQCTLTVTRWILRRRFAIETSAAHAHAVLLYLLHAYPTACPAGSLVRQLAFSLSKVSTARNFSASLLRSLNLG